VLQKQKDPSLENKMQLIESYLNSGASARMASDSVFNVPVVVHVLYNNSTQNITSDQILSQIESLNRDFSRTNADTAYTPTAFRDRAGRSKIKFSLATADPNGNPTSGIVRIYTPSFSFQPDDKMKFTSSGGNNAWPSGSYLNIWVCNMPGVLGYAQFPGGDPLTDGVVITYNAFGTRGTLRNSYDKGRTATHEIGHWLGLKHIWGDAGCGDDQVNDTPIQQQASSGCPSFPHISCTNNGSGDMFMNYMDYTDDACMNMFTAGQVERMQALLSTARESILSSKGNTPNPISSVQASINGQQNTEIVLYPSPARQFIRISFPEKSAGLKITFINALGEVVKVIPGFERYNNMELDISSLKSGIYFYVLESQELFHKDKFVVIR
jgi:hypothetical protein